MFSEYFQVFRIFIGNEIFIRTFLHEYPECQGLLDPTTTSLFREEDHAGAGQEDASSASERIRVSLLHSKRCFTVQLRKLKYAGGELTMSARDPQSFGEAVGGGGRASRVRCCDQ